MVLFVPRPWYQCCCRHNLQVVLWSALLSWPCKMLTPFLLLTTWWAHNPQVFPRIFSHSCNLFRRSLILFNYDVSMNFISHIPSSRSIWINSHIWLNLAFFFIPECLINSWCCSRHHSQLANSKECFSQSCSILVNIVISASCYLLICSNHEYSFLAIRCFSELFSFSILRRPSFQKILRSQLSAFILNSSQLLSLRSSLCYSGASFKFSVRWLMISSFSCISIHSWRFIIF